MSPAALLLLVALLGVPVLIGLSDAGDEVPGRGTVSLSRGPTLIWITLCFAVCWFVFGRLL